ncbi:unnamed protein product [Rotaria socialis]|uniref:Uncharacterized protein n=2 Tax=Rotaria socialis TaxID=392032 RepID=A0A821CVY0_9BILA|nr:unnamed protein product [Rotaria socialis]CAF3430087.1 unnamed protein product [Rotaria socialis]CAF4524082.1 unnamed protein product [Rotaria socialis]CAF4612267.1 unnamed protein product [Rotaria socialis]
MQIIFVSLIVVLLQQNIQLAHGVTCASNPCNITPPFDASTGYCCYDVPPNNVDSVCVCPNNIPPVLNGPCRNSTAPGAASCSRTCFNGGVCNIVNGAEVCWCTLGFSGSFCELQGTVGRCVLGLCQYGTCVENTIGTAVHAYCHCNPGWTGMKCNQSYFTCTQAGVFPDTAYCATGRYFYCPQVNGAPIIATCPNGMRFNRVTNNCDANYFCT